VSLPALVAVLVAGLLLYLVLPQIGYFRDSLHVLTSARPLAVITGLVGVLATFCLAAFIYLRLALRPLPYGPTLAVELAAAFANRLLPAGVGALGVHGVYLVRQHHRPAEATAVVGMNNLLGIAGHLLLLVLVLAIGRQAVVPSVQWRLPLVVPVIVGGLLVVVAVLLWRIPWLKRQVLQFGRTLWSSFHNYLRRPGRLLLVLAMAMLLTVLYTAILYCCSRAVGLTLSPGVVFLVFSAGMIGGTATPTPGGLVGAEAGLLAGFSAYHAATAPALAAVLLYRLLTYWLPLLPGGVSFMLIRRKYIL
jgi:undecaprenyl-diphosphatase